MGIQQYIQQNIHGQLHTEYNYHSLGKPKILQHNLNKLYLLFLVILLGLDTEYSR